MPIENEAEENPRITAIEAPETSNLRPFVYRFTFTKYRKIKRRFYRLFVKTLKTRCGQRLERIFHVGTWGNLDREAKRYTAPHRKTMIAGIVWPDLPIPPRRNGATSERIRSNNSWIDSRREPKRGTESLRKRHREPDR